MNKKTLITILTIHTIGVIVIFIVLFNNFLKDLKEIYPTHKNQNYIELMEEMDSINNICLKKQDSIKNINIFLNAIGFVESRNKYHAVNTNGYIGKYQFGTTTLVATNVCETIDDAVKFRDEFINSPDTLRTLIWTEREQDLAMIRLMELNKEHLKKYIAKYSHTFHNGIYITESGILAAAHLAGCGGVKSYFNTNFNATDSYGTSITNYLIKFSNYNI